MPLATSVTTDNLAVVLPSWTSDQASILIRASDGASAGDSVDQYFSVRGGSGSFTNPAAPATVQIGSDIVIRWISPPGSVSVSLSFWDSVSQVLRPIVSGLPDYGHYTWDIPDFSGAGDYVEATFFGSNGSVLGSITSPLVNLVYALNTGLLVPLYRAYSPYILDHLFTIDPNEYAVLGASGWSLEGVAAHIYNGPVTTGSIGTVPFYRFYNTSTLQHLWTADRNEYFVLNGSDEWISEGIAGDIFDQPVSGTIALYRLRSSNLHVWTSSTNEDNVLLSEGWISEGIAGYVFP